MANEESKTQKGFAFFNNLVDEQVNRLNAVYDEVEKVQTKSFEHAEDVVDEWAVLGKASMAYAQHLSDEWRKMSLDVLRSSTDLFQSSKG